MTPRRFAVGASEHHRTVVAGGVALAYDDRGQGPALVAMHAITHGSRDYESVAGALSKDWRLITFDWPGHGRSGADVQPAGVARYTELLAALLDTLEIQRVVLLGNSIGGAVAMAYAARFPDRVAALVLADPGGLRPMDALGRRFCGAMAALGRAGTRRALYFKPLFALMYRLLLRTKVARAQRQRIVDAAAECGTLWTQAWTSFRSPAADQSDIGPRIRCPVLFAWARRDPVIPYAASKAAVRRFPHHALAFFDGGHCPQLEAPEAFLAAVLPFLQNLKTK